MVANRLKYYVHTKASLPLDIEFTVQDIFAVTRPQWKFATSLDEATKAFQLAISQDQKSAGVDKYAEADDATSGASSEDENENGDGDEIEAYGDGDEDSASDEEDIEVRQHPIAMINAHANVLSFRRMVMTTRQLMTAISMTSLLL
jgi:hypothetical protein